MSVSLTTPTTLEAAIAAISARTPVGTRLRTRDFARIPAQLRRRALFSAGLENARALGRMRRLLLAAVEGARVGADGQVTTDAARGARLDRSLFAELMRETMVEEGLAHAEGEPGAGGVEDLASYRRQRLVFDMQVGGAQNFAAYVADTEPAILDGFPCYELVRFEPRVEERDWPERWAEAGGEFFGGEGAGADYPSAPGRMVAPKTSPIWLRLSRFGNPHAPFDWGSGMNQLALSRRECEALGAIAPGERVPPPEDPDFNAGHDVTLGADDATAADLADWFAAEGVAAEVDTLEGRARLP